MLQSMGMPPNASQWHPAIGSASLLGPCPPTQPQAYHMSFTPSHLSLLTPTQPSWDQVGLIVTMNGMSTQALG